MMKAIGLMALLLLYTGSASAHTGVGVHGGLGSGFLHPLLGWDHLLPMFALGLWAGSHPARSALLLPLLFPLLMAAGAAMGVYGMGLPWVESGIALSAVTFGLMVTFNVRPTLSWGMPLVALFAVWHGHAHGSEMPLAGSALWFTVGFVASTALLHLSGIALGKGLRHYSTVLRTSGALVALAGAGFLLT